MRFISPPPPSSLSSSSSVSPPPKEAESAAQPSFDAPPPTAVSVPAAAAAVESFPKPSDRRKAPPPSTLTSAPAPPPPPSPAPTVESFPKPSDLRKPASVPVFAKPLPKSSAAPSPSPVKAAVPLSSSASWTVPASPLTTASSARLPGTATSTPLSALSSSPSKAKFVVTGGPQLPKSLQPGVLPLDAFRARRQNRGLDSSQHSVASAASASIHSVTGSATHNNNDADLHNSIRSNHSRTSSTSSITNSYQQQQQHQQPPSHLLGPTDSPHGSSGKLTLEDSEPNLLATEEAPKSPTPPSTTTTTIPTPPQPAAAAEMTESDQPPQTPRALSPAAQLNDNEVTARPSQDTETEDIPPSHRTEPVKQDDAAGTDEQPEPSTSRPAENNNNNNANEGQEGEASKEQPLEEEWEAVEDEQFHEAVEEMDITVLEDDSRQGEEPKDDSRAEQQEGANADSNVAGGEAEEASVQEAKDDGSKQEEPTTKESTAGANSDELSPEENRNAGSGDNMEQQKQSGDALEDGSEVDEPGHDSKKRGFSNHHDDDDEEEEIVEEEEKQEDQPPAQSEEMEELMDGSEHVEEVDASENVEEEVEEEQEARPSEHVEEVEEGGDEQDAEYAHEEDDVYTSDDADMNQARGGPSAREQSQSVMSNNNMEDSQGMERSQQAVDNANASREMSYADSYQFSTAEDSHQTVSVADSEQAMRDSQDLVTVTESSRDKDSQPYEGGMGESTEMEEMGESGEMEERGGETGEAAEAMGESDADLAEVGESDADDGGMGESAANVGGGEETGPVVRMSESGDVSGMGDETSADALESGEEYEEEYEEVYEDEEVEEVEDDTDGEHLEASYSSSPPANEYPETPLTEGEELEAVKRGVQRAAYFENTQEEYQGSDDDGQLEAKTYEDVSDSTDGVDAENVAPAYQSPPPSSSSYSEIRNLSQREKPEAEYFKPKLTPTTLRYSAPAAYPSEQDENDPGVQKKNSRTDRYSTPIVAPKVSKFQPDQAHVYQSRNIRGTPTRLAASSTKSRSPAVAPPAPEIKSTFSVDDEEPSDEELFNGSKHTAPSDIMHRMDEQPREVPEDLYSGSRHTTASDIMQRMGGIPREVPKSSDAYSLASEVSHHQTDDQTADESYKRRRAADPPEENHNMQKFVYKTALAQKVVEEDEMDNIPPGSADAPGPFGAPGQQYGPYGQPYPPPPGPYGQPGYAPNASYGQPGYYGQPPYQGQPALIPAEVAQMPATEKVPEPSVEKPKEIPPELTVGGSRGLVPSASADGADPPGTTDEEVQHTAMNVRSQDIESGMPETAEPPKAPPNKRKKGFCASRFVQVICCIICLAVIGAGVAVALIMTNDDDPPPSNSRSIDLGRTRSPTIPPTQPPSQLATNATSSPTPERLWTLINNFSANVASSGFGSAVAVSGNNMAAGVPGFDTTGGTQTYVKTAAGWTAQKFLTTLDTGGRFGSAVALSSTPQGMGLVIGAPFALDTQNLQEAFGAAYVYVFRPANSTWTPLGQALRPFNFTPAESDGNYGYAVSLARDVMRVVVGAPYSSSINSAGNALRSGRLYVYGFNGNTWVPSGTRAIIGDQSEDNLGTSVVISANGQRIVAGAPGIGNTGGFFSYVFNSTLGGWARDQSKAGAGSGEFFGSSVAMMSDNGDSFAVGGPGYGGGAGVIRVYQVQGGSLVQLGPDIVGADGDKLGSERTLAGSSRIVFAGTAKGAVKSFTYSESTNTWDPFSEGVDLPVAGDRVDAVSAIPGGTSFVAGTESGRVAVYDWK